MAWVLPTAWSHLCWLDEIKDGVNSVGLLIQCPQVSACFSGLFAADIIAAQVEFDKHELWQYGEALLYLE